ncbi:hypothetical protein AMTRI_Chr11g94790 [Amborella trichopoda]|uniref:Zinc finger PHD-type domain-containing protein n=1 Tax=Amborella trichopoda TaxID=13333 RepID=U5D6S3_AMBTC|nr:uncharacterized protein LOC18444329 [Amborella trichopoda]ERN16033.1 hypothetical protein AMTR_s00030p00103480 [Amborella trichopoda]|eukprot:XP_006854566.1 uncharacterized protein LOC18444329 [Amborella trichopoda]
MVEKGEIEEASRLLNAAGSSSLPPRKRLLAGLKQNGWVDLDHLVEESRSSTSSAKSMEIGNPNASKELPRISECHSCSYLVSGKGKDKLHTLASEWRVVLLCKNCLNAVNSGTNCSYCFSALENSGCVLNCRKCDHRVHQGCASKHRGSLLQCSSGSFLCVDCWVPKSRLNFGCGSNKSDSFGTQDSKSLLRFGETKVFGDCDSKAEKSVSSASFPETNSGSVDKTMVSVAIKPLDKENPCIDGESELNKYQDAEKHVSDSVSEKASRFSFNGNCCRSLEEIVKEANSAAARAMTIAASAKENALRKAMVARNAASAARNALNFLAILEQEENEAKESLQSNASLMGDDGNSNIADRAEKSNGIHLKAGSLPESHEVADEELALRLHRAMNSSPRISRRRGAPNGIQLKECKLSNSTKCEFNCMVTTKKQNCSNGFGNEEFRRNERRFRRDSEVIGQSTSILKTESGSQSVCGNLHLCTEDKIDGTLDHPDAEPSVGNGALELANSIGMAVEEFKKRRDDEAINGVSFHEDEEKKEGTMQGAFRSCRADGKVDMKQNGGMNMENSLKNGLLIVDGDNSGVKDMKPETPVKEEQASCSNKAMNSSGEDSSLDTGFESSQKWKGGENGGSSSNVSKVKPFGYRAKLSKFNCAQSQAREGDPLKPQKKRSILPHPDSKRPIKRHSSMKVILDRKTKSLAEDFPLESKALTNALPLLQRNCAKAPKKLSDSSHGSPSVQS